MPGPLTLYSLIELPVGHTLGKEAPPVQPSLLFVPATLQWHSATTGPCGPIPPGGIEQGPDGSLYVPPKDTQVALGDATLLGKVHGPEGAL